MNTKSEDEYLKNRCADQLIRQSGNVCPISVNAISVTQSLQEQQESMGSKYCHAPFNNSLGFAGSSSGQGIPETMVSPDSSAGAVPKPKRPRTAYNLFFRHKQEKINHARQHSPKSSKTAAAISVYWKNLPYDQKVVYFQRATEDKFRYYKEKHEYGKYIKRLEEKKQAEAEKAGVAAEATGHDNGQVQAQVRVIRDGTNPTLQVEVDVPPFSHEAIALLASKLDQQSIDFLIKALK